MDPVHWRARLDLVEVERGLLHRSEVDQVPAWREQNIVHCTEQNSGGPVRKPAAPQSLHNNITATKKLPQWKSKFSFLRKKQFPRRYILFIFILLLIAPFYLSLCYNES